jgi:hypothetical protein
MTRASEPPMKELRLSYDFVEIRDFMLSARQERDLLGCEHWRKI